MRIGNIDIEGIANMALFGRMGTGGAPLIEIVYLLLVVIVIKIMSSPEPPLWLTNAMDTICFRTTKISVCTISHRRISTYAWGLRDDNDGSQNRILQNAIMCNINNGGFRWHSSHAAFVENAEISRSVRDYDSDDGKKTSTVKSLMDRYKVLIMPPYDQWIQVQGNVWFKRHKSSNSDNDNKRSEETEVYYLRGTNRDIDAYIYESIESYNTFLDNGKDDTRYMYMPFRRTDEENKLLAYKRYPLSDVRTFDTLYIPEKDSILRLIDQFSRKEGKFAIEGYPYKLGFLLYGPPGTGKTSFIKALAYHTKRHIVSISLDKLKTNQELISMVYDRKYIIDGDDIRHEMDFEDIVFVMEDVDAAGTIANRASESSSQVIDAAEVTDAAIDNSSHKSSSIPVSTAAKKPLPDEDDALNLAGILNVLDGVLDSPNRIVVMTTNHPEKLDPALIRPGRVNMQVHMTYIKPAQAIKMLRHYFADDIENIDESLLSILENEDISPAKLEAMCGQHMSIHSLLKELNE